MSETKKQKTVEKDAVKLSDVIRIALPFSTQVIVGSNNERKSAQREVHWVALLISRDDLKAQVNAGDLVICPPSLQQTLTANQFADLLRELENLDAAAVTVSKKVNSAAEKLSAELNLPLLITDGSVSVRDIHRSVAALLIDRQSLVSERGMQLYRELSEMSREGDGLNKMAKLLGKITGKIVVIQDKRLEIQAISKPTGSLEIDEQSLLTALSNQDDLPKVLRNRKAAAKSPISHWQQLLFPHESAARLISPIISGDRARGYLSIIGAADEIDMLDSVAVEQGSAACALEMAKAKAISEAKKALRGNFLEGILAGTISPKEIDRLSSRLDHKTDAPHAVMTFSWADADDASLRRIETTANWLLSTNNRKTLVHVYGENHVCIFQTLRKDDGMRDALQLAKRLREQLQADRPDAILYGGVAGPADSLAEWPDEHAKALQAMAVGMRLQLKELVEYGSLGVYRLLSQLDDVPAVHAFCDQVIGPLVNYDERHKSKLVHTMEQYFNHHGNVSQTAEALFIHRNTLLYRLERIQDLTDHDLNMADMRLALHIALKLWQLRPDN